MNEDTNKLLNVISKISERMDELSPGKGVGYYAIPYKQAIKLQGINKIVLPLRCCYCGETNIFMFNDNLMGVMAGRYTSKTVHFECYSCKKIHDVYAKDDIFYVVAVDKQ